MLLKVAKIVFFPLKKILFCVTHDSQAQYLTATCQLDCLKFSTSAKVGRPLKINSDLPTVAGDSIASCLLHLHVDEQINSNAQIFNNKKLL
jgi:hypothetical protein